MQAKRITSRISTSAADGAQLAADSVIYKPLGIIINQRKNGIKKRRRYSLLFVIHRFFADRIFVKACVQPLFCLFCAILPFIEQSSPKTKQVFRFRRNTPQKRRRPYNLPSVR